jgi:ribosomal protein L30/L7E
MFSAADSWSKNYYRAADPLRLELLDANRLLTTLCRSWNRTSAKKGDLLKLFRLTSRETKSEETEDADIYRMMRQLGLPNITPDFSNHPDHSLKELGEKYESRRIKRAFGAKNKKVFQLLGRKLGWMKTGLSPDLRDA